MSITSLRNAPTSNSGGTTATINPNGENNIDNLIKDFFVNKIVGLVTKFLNLGSSSINTTLFLSNLISSRWKIEPPANNPSSKPHIELKINHTISVNNPNSELGISPPPLKIENPSQQCEINIEPNRLKKPLAGHRVNFELYANKSTNNDSNHNLTAPQHHDFSKVTVAESPTKPESAVDWLNYSLSLEGQVCSPIVQLKSQSETSIANTLCAAFNQNNSIQLSPQDTLFGLEEKTINGHKVTFAAIKASTEKQNEYTLKIIPIIEISAQLKRCQQSSRLGYWPKDGLYNASTELDAIYHELPNAIESYKNELCTKYQNGSLIVSDEPSESIDDEGSQFGDAQPVAYNAPPIFMSAAGVGRSAAMASLQYAKTVISDHFSNTKQIPPSLSDQEIVEMVTNIVIMGRFQRSAAFISSEQQFESLCLAVKQFADDKFRQP